MLEDTIMDNKPFKTVDEQIAILESRGITMDDQEFARKFLVSRNYYSMINDYGRFFTISSDVYIPGTTLKDINYVYIFDKAIKTILFTHTLEFEKYLKSSLAYYFCEAHPGHNEYLFPVNYNHQSSDKYEKSVALIKHIQSVISDYSAVKASPNGIKHYSETYKYVPLWVVIQFMYLGDVIKMFDYCDNAVQTKVCRVFSEFVQSYNKDNSIIINPGSLKKIMISVKDIRNCVAHNNRILNISASRSLPYMPKIHIPLGIKEKETRSDLYNILVIFQCLISPEEYNNMVHSFKNRIKDFKKKTTIIDYNKVPQSLGFPKDWIDSI